MIINGDGGYGLLAAYIGWPAAQAGWLGPKVGGHLVLFLYSSREPSELSQWLCYDDSPVNIIVIIIIIMIGYVQNQISNQCDGSDLLKFIQNQICTKRSTFVIKTRSARTHLRKVRLRGQIISYAHDACDQSVGTGCDSMM